EDETRQRLPVESDRPPPPEPDNRDAGRPGRLRQGIARVERLRRKLPRVVRLSAADRRAPEPFVDRIERGPGGDRDAEGGAVFRFFLTRDARVTHRREHFEL